MELLPHSRSSQIKGEIDTSWAAFVASAGMLSGPADFQLFSVLIAFLISSVVGASRLIHVGKFDKLKLNQQTTKQGFIVLFIATS